jgi:hypothetical protein
MDDQARLDLYFWQQTGEKLQAVNPETFRELLLRLALFAEREGDVARLSDLPPPRNSFFVSA